jgi:nucleoside-diphosphate-sugar epimerase
MEVVIVRPGALYGPRDREFLPAFRAARLGLVPLLAGRGQSHNLCHVADAVAATILAGEMPGVSGMAFLIGGPSDRTMEEIGRALCALFSRKPTFLPVPRLALEAVALGADTWAWLTGEPTMLGRQKIPELTGDWRFDLSPARNRLGYRPRWEIEDGFAATLEWYRQEEWL